jgi:hypothetical protein
MKTMKTMKTKSFLRGRFTVYSEVTRMKTIKLTLPKQKFIKLKQNPCPSTYNKIKYLRVK